MISLNNFVIFNILELEFAALLLVDIVNMIKDDHDLQDSAYGLPSMQN